MNKLIRMLNVFTFIFPAITSTISCLEEGSKKHHKIHKQEQNDNEDSSDEDLSSIIEKIKKMIKIAKVEANDTNTVLNLTKEIKVRIEKIIKDKPINFELNIDEKNETKLEEKSYQFNIKLNKINSESEEENDILSVLVQKEESNLEKYERISKKIENHMINKEIDLSSFKELDANGTILWKETLSNITEPSKIYNYFNFQELGANFKAEYSNVVDFKLSTDHTKNTTSYNEFSTFNSENECIPVTLKISKGGSSDSNFKDKNVNFKIKVGGLTYEQIYQLQVDAANRVVQYSGDLGFKFSENDFDSYWASTKFENRTYKNMIYYFLHQKGLDSTIYPYLKITSKIRLFSTFHKELDWDEHVFELFSCDAYIEIILFPRIRNNWKYNKDYAFPIVIDLKNYLKLETNTDKMFALFSRLTSKLKYFEQITLHKKDALNGKQLTYRDLYGKSFIKILNAFGADPYIGMANGLSFRINFYKNSVLLKRDSSDPITEGEYKYKYSCEYTTENTYHTFFIKIED